MCEYLHHHVIPIAKLRFAEPMNKHIQEENDEKETSGYRRSGRRAESSGQGEAV
jgi:hypothetical protein